MNYYLFEIVFPYCAVLFSSPSRKLEPYVVCLKVMIAILLIRVLLGSSGLLFYVMIYDFSYMQYTYRAALVHGNSLATITLISWC